MSVKKELKEIIRDTIITMNIIADDNEISHAAEYIVSNFFRHPEWTVERWGEFYKEKSQQIRAVSKQPHYLAIPRVEDAPDLYLIAPGDPRIHCFYQFLPYTKEDEKKYKSAKPYTPTSPVIYLKF